MDSQNLDEILRQAAKADERSQAQIARESGLTPAQLSRFLAGKRGLMLSAAGRLAQVVGLTLTKEASSDGQTQAR